MFFIFRFHFPQNDFKSNKAFHSKFVTRQSNIIIVCPNIATVLSEGKEKQPANSLYENIWMVNEKDFYDCKIDIKIKENQLIHQCNQPEQLSFYNINFANVHYSKQANLSSIYLLGKWFDLLIDIIVFQERIIGGNSLL